MLFFDGWIHGEHIMKFTLNQFTDDECNKLINLAWSGFRKASFMDPCRDASRYNGIKTHIICHEIWL